MKPLVSKDYTGAQALNPAWRYVPEAHSDIRATFARIRDEQAKQAEQAAPKSKVRRIR